MAKFWAFFGKSLVWPKPWSSGYGRRLIYVGHEFESQLCILDGHFSHLYVIKIVMFGWKDEINKKRPRMAHFLIKNYRAIRSHFKKMINAQINIFNTWPRSTTAYGMESLKVWLEPNPFPFSNWLKPVPTGLNWLLANEFPKLKFPAEFWNWLSKLFGVKVLPPPLIG